MMITVWRCVSLLVALSDTPVTINDPVVPKNFPDYFDKLKTCCLNKNTEVEIQQQVFRLNGKLFLLLRKRKFFWKMVRQVHLNMLNTALWPPLLAIRCCLQFICSPKIIYVVFFYYAVCAHTWPKPLLCDWIIWLAECCKIKFRYYFLCHEFISDNWNISLSLLCRTRNSILI